MLLCTYRVYQTCGGDFAFDVILFSSLAFSQQYFLYSQKEQILGITLFAQSFVGGYRAPKNQANHISSALLLWP